MDQTKNESKLKTAVSKKRNGRATKPSLAENNAEMVPTKRTRQTNSRSSDTIEEKPNPVQSEGKSKPVQSDAKSKLVRSEGKSKPVAAAVDLPKDVSTEGAASGQNRKEVRKKATVTKVNEVGSRGSSGIPKKRRKNKHVRYEVDCTNVDKDILDLQAYLQLQMIVAGKKNNPHLRVKSKGKTIIVKCSIYVSKDTVRFITKKYLKRKKMQSVRVLTKTKEAYQLIPANAN